MKASYTKTLNKIERFMESSGIRDICSNYCMGRCCEGCYKSEKACHKNEGRRLPCSFYICYTLKKLVFTDHEEEIFSNISRIVGAKIKGVTPGCNPGYLNIYFNVNDQSTRNKFSIDLETISKLDEINRDDVRAKAFALCRLHKDFCLKAKKSGK